ncbi:MAG: DUF1801 domain-containing protein [Gammaproteobacteria bacterium]|nr:DUF1801 domain-containing protein [Gammaproteobacteria bacterium]
MEPAVEKKFESFPKNARLRLYEIRELIFDVANSDNVGTLTETLKWGEPSYLSTNGSTVRINWSSKNPKVVSIYFNCKTVLVETFRELFQGTFQYIGNREITLPLSKCIPVLELKACISMTLRYHKIKHLPLLGE